MVWDTRAGRGRAAVRHALARAAFYGFVAAAGFGLFVLLIQSGLLAQVGILFYRGSALLGVAFGLTWAAAAAGARCVGRATVGPDAFSAAALSLSLNLAFFVLVPVTVDRSVSVFMLGEMAAHPDGSYTPATMRGAFERRYLDEYRQIERRLDEQVASGNLARTPDGFRITAQGERFVRSSRLIARLFGTERRFVEVEASPAR